MIRALLAACLCLLIGASARGQEYIVTDGPLSDRDFYRLVSCAARPGRSCNQVSVAWQKPVVTVAFAPVPSGYPARLAGAFDRSLDMAISQINGAAPGLTLRRVSKGQAADVRLYLQTIRAGHAIRGTGFREMNGTPIGAALVQVYWDEDRALSDAAIAFAMDIPINQARAIMIEELTQAMGLMTDIRNPYYNTRSVFSEDSNSVQKLGRQDRDALRRHYPSSTPRTRRAPTSKDVL